VFLDVVYNHTSEGNHLGPCSPQGIDNTAIPDRRRQPALYMDYTGHREFV